MSKSVKRLGLQEACFTQGLKNTLPFGGIDKMADPGFRVKSFGSQHLKPAPGAEWMPKRMSEGKLVSQGLEKF